MVYTAREHSNSKYEATSTPNSKFGDVYGTFEQPEAEVLGCSAGGGDMLSNMAKNTLSNLMSNIMSADAIFEIFDEDDDRYALFYDSDISHDSNVTNCTRDIPKCSTWQASMSTLDVDSSGCMAEENSFDSLDGSSILSQSNLPFMEGKLTKSFVSDLSRMENRLAEEAVCEEIFEKRTRNRALSCEESESMELDKDSFSTISITSTKKALKVEKSEEEIIFIVREILKRMVARSLTGTDYDVRQETDLEKGSFKADFKSGVSIMIQHQLQILCSIFLHPKNENIDKLANKSYSSKTFVINYVWKCLFTMLSRKNETEEFSLKCSDDEKEEEPGNIESSVLEEIANSHGSLTSKVQDEEVKTIEEDLTPIEVRETSDQTAKVQDEELKTIEADLAPIEVNETSDGTNLPTSVQPGKEEIQSLEISLKNVTFYVERALSSIEREHGLPSKEFISESGQNDSLGKISMGSKSVKKPEETSPAELDSLDSTTICLPKDKVVSVELREFYEAIELCVARSKLSGVSTSEAMAYSSLNSLIQVAQKQDTSTLSSKEDINYKETHTSTLSSKEYINYKETQMRDDEEVIESRGSVLDEVPSEIASTQPGDQKDHVMSVQPQENMIDKVYELKERVALELVKSEENMRGVVLELETEISKMSSAIEKEMTEIFNKSRKDENSMSQKVDGNSMSQRIQKEIENMFSVQRLGDSSIKKEIIENLSKQSSEGKKVEKAILEVIGEQSSEEKLPFVPESDKTEKMLNQEVQSLEIEKTSSDINAEESSDISKEKLKETEETTLSNNSQEEPKETKGLTIPESISGMISPSSWFNLQGTESNVLTEDVTATTTADVVRFFTNKFKWFEESDSKAETAKTEIVVSSEIIGIQTAHESNIIDTAVENVNLSNLTSDRENEIDQEKSKDMKSPDLLVEEDGKDEVKNQKSKDTKSPDFVEEDGKDQVKNEKSKDKNSPHLLAEEGGKDQKRNQSEAKEARRSTKSKELEGNKERANEIAIPTFQNNDDPESYVDNVLDIMRSSFENPVTQKQASKALSRMAVYSHYRSVIGSKGGAAIVLQAISAQLENPRVIDSAIGALMNIALEDIAKKEIADTNGISLILIAMQRFKDDLKIQRNTTGFLRNVTHKSTVCQKQVITSSGLHAVLKSLHSFSHDKVVKENGLAVLLNITSDCTSDVVMKMLDGIIKDSELFNPEFNSMMARFILNSKDEELPHKDVETKITTRRQRKHLLMQGLNIFNKKKKKGGKIKPEDPIREPKSKTTEVARTKSNKNPTEVTRTKSNKNPTEVTRTKSNKSHVKNENKVDFVAPSKETMTKDQIKTTNKNSYVAGNLSINESKSYTQTDKVAADETLGCKTKADQKSFHKECDESKNAGQNNTPSNEPSWSFKVEDPGVITMFLNKYWGGVSYFRELTSSEGNTQSPDTSNGYMEAVEVEYIPRRVRRQTVK